MTAFGGLHLPWFDCFDRAPLAHPVCSCCVCTQHPGWRFEQACRPLLRERCGVVGDGIRRSHEQVDLQHQEGRHAPPCYRCDVCVAPSCRSLCALLLAYALACRGARRAHVCKFWLCCALCSPRSPRPRLFRRRLSLGRFKQLLLLHTNRDYLPPSFLLDWGELFALGVSKHSFGVDV